MARYQKCKVCGKTYDACKRPAVSATVFNFRNQTCSSKCGQEYVRIIEKSRESAILAEPHFSGVITEEQTKSPEVPPQLTEVAEADESATEHKDTTLKAKKVGKGS